MEMCFGRFTHILYVLFSCCFELRHVLVRVIILINGLTCGSGYRYKSPVVGARQGWLVSGWLLFWKKKVVGKRVKLWCIKVRRVCMVSNGFSLASFGATAL